MDQYAPDFIPDLNTDRLLEYLVADEPYPKKRIFTKEEEREELWKDVKYPRKVK